MDKSKLKAIIDHHQRWLCGEDGGIYADLRGADLHDANLHDANLCGADLHDANLCGADLRGADLRYANLCDANLRSADLRYASLHDANLRGADLHDANLHDANLCGADLHDADLRGADLHDANLHDANLCGADLHDANLCGADLHDANLCGADLCGADLHDANLCDADLRGAKNVPFIPMSCPDKGSFTAWKKAQDHIVKLLIPENARRSSATGRKCRCDIAIVVAIETLDGRPSGCESVASDYTSTFVYKIGETVTEPNFCEDRFQECASGIHFFINRQEAVNYYD